MKRLTLILEILTMFWRRRGNGAIDVSYESRTAQMLAFTYSRAKLLKSNKSVSQSCAVAKSEKVWRATAQSRTQTLVLLLRIRRACAVRSLRKPIHNPTWRTNGWLQQKLLVPTQLHFCQRSSPPFCLPSLIVQWPARIVHFSLLRMIVKLASKLDKLNKLLIRLLN